MVEQPINRDLFDVLESLSHDQLIEFVEQLQNSVDGSEARNDASRLRVVKLEADREILRSRLDVVRSDLAKLRANPLGRVASRFTSSAESAATQSPADDTVAISPAKGLRAATILDEISDACWSPEFDNVRLTRRDWRQQLEASTPDLLFVESAFSGVGGSWARRIAHFGGPHQDIRELTSACRDLGIPTIFWNKEDPVNYPWFIGAASAFDLIFTVDADQIPKYKHDLGHSRVHVLPFAAQPALHYPPDDDEDKPGSVGFAGSYYARKHAQRRVQMDMLLTPALEFDLDIYDRMDRTDDPRFTWPERFRQRVVGSVPYPEMGDVYRRYKVFLNVNTVTDSPTMMARRIFELAATGTPIVSGPSEAIDHLVPPGIVEVVTSPSETSKAIEAALTDRGQKSYTSHAATQWIAESNTYSHRLARIMSTLAR